MNKKFIIFSVTLILVISKISAQSSPTYFQATSVQVGKLPDKAFGKPMSTSTIFLLNISQKELTILSEAAKVFRIADVENKKKDGLNFFVITAYDRSNDKYVFSNYTISSNGKPQIIFVMVSPDNRIEMYDVELKNTY